MKIVNYVVKEVLSEPIPKSIKGTNYSIEWYEVKVITSTNEVTTLDFRNLIDAKLLFKGFKFFRAV